MGRDIIIEEEGIGGIVLCQTPDGQTNLEVKLENDTVWLTRQQMAVILPPAGGDRTHLEQSGTAVGRWRPGSRSELRGLSEWALDAQRLKPRVPQQRAVEDGGSSAKPCEFCPHLPAAVRKQGLLTHGSATTSQRHNKSPQVSPLPTCNVVVSIARRVSQARKLSH